MKIKFGITEKLIAAVVFPVVLLMVATGYYSFKFQRELLLTQFDERARTMIESLATSSEYPILTGNEKLLQNIGSAFLFREDVSVCEIKDKNGVVLFRGVGKVKTVVPRRYEAPVTTERVTSPDDMMFGGSEKQKREEIGKVYLGLSLDRVMREMERQRAATVALLLLGILAILIFITFLIRIILGRPVSELMKGTRAIASGDLQYEVPVITHDEIGMLALSFNKMTQDLQGTTTSVDNLNKEINERKKIEGALRQAEERYRMQFEGALDAIFLADTETGILIDCNPAGARLLGKERAEIIGQHQKMLHPQTSAENKFSYTFQQHLGEKKGVALEEQVITKNGEIKYVAITANMFEFGGKKILQGIFRDITESKKAAEEIKNAYEQLKQAQTQLVQTAKMASVGMLAGGVAHEINNPLTGVLNNVQLVKMMVEQKSNFDIKEFKEIIDVIENSALRCKKITQSLLDFSRSSKGTFQMISLNKIAEDVSILIEHELGLQNITIQKDLEPNLPDISGDPQLLQQVIFDIIANAKWAVQKKSEKEGGTITIKTHYEPKENNVSIFVSDTGIGIPKENLEKIFEPFFTTKNVGEGTGLGLAIVYGIIKAHKGIIKVESESGKGTTFTIVLPA
jgi:two-component system, NtrC family, sensor kinase